MKELKTWKEVVQAMLNNEQVEVFNNELGEWLDVLHFPFFRSTELLDAPATEYRVKPSTIIIGDIEVPEPVRDASEFNEGDSYYFPNFHREGLYDFYTWDGGDLDLRLLKHGIIHKTRESAVLHAKALVKISGGDYE